MFTSRDCGSTLLQRMLTIAEPTFLDALIAKQPNQTLGMNIYLK